jgi:hypothetical protein
VLGGAGAFERVVAVLLCLFGALALARGSLLGLSSGGLRGGLGGDRGLGARDRVLRASLGVLGERLGVALAGFGAACSLAGGLLGRLRPGGGRERCLGGFVSLEPFAAGGRLELA